MKPVPRPHPAPTTSARPASLDLNFLASTSLDSRITFTRASSAWYFNSAGVLTQAATNAPRFDYSPTTLALNGLLLEGQSTNSIRNNTMQGAVVGDIGAGGALPTNWTVSSIGLTCTVVAVGTTNGINYIDLRLHGTTTSQFGQLVLETIGQIAASNGQAWTPSLFLALTAGSLNNLNPTTGFGFRVDTYNNTNAFLSHYSTFITSPTATLTRYAGPVTISDATAASVVMEVLFNGAHASGDAVDFTIRIGLPQLEQLPLYTSPIPTTNAAVTRARDSAAMALGSWYTTNPFSLVGEAKWWAVPASPSAAPDIAEINDGTLNNRTAAWANLSGNLLMLDEVGGVVKASQTLGTLTANTPQKVGYSILSGSMLGCANGGSVTTVASTSIPTGQTTLDLGQAAANGGILNGWLRRVRYFNHPLSASELIRYTT